MTGLQRDGHLVGQHPPARHVDDGGEVHEHSGHKDVSRVQRPDLIGTGDGHLALRVGVDFVPRVAFAGAQLRAQRRDAHALHQRAQVVPAYAYAFAQHACVHERRPQSQLVYAAHDYRVSVADPGTKYQCN